MSDKGIFDDFEKRAQEIADQEANIHEQYLMSLLALHGITEENIKNTFDWNVVSDNPLAEWLSKNGYYIERRATKSKDGFTLYQYILYKEIARSPIYKIRRVISVEEKDAEN